MTVIYIVIFLLIRLTIYWHLLCATYQALSCHQGAHGPRKKQESKYDKAWFEIELNAEHSGLSFWKRVHLSWVLGDELELRDTRWLLRGDRKSSTPKEKHRGWGAGAVRATVPCAAWGWRGRQEGAEKASSALPGPLLAAVSARVESHTQATKGRPEGPNLHCPRSSSFFLFKFCHCFYCKCYCFKLGYTLCRMTGGWWGGRNKLVNDEGF